jgi:hypothetical protein
MTTSQWLRVLSTAPIALGVSWLCLVLRYRHQGRPFASAAAAKWALATIVWTATVAVAVVVGVLKLDPAVPFTIVLLLPPFLLCADTGIQKFGAPDSTLEDAAWYKIATVGVVVFLDGLKKEEGNAWIRWRDGLMNPDWTPRQCKDFANKALFSLGGRDDGLTLDLQSDLDAVEHAAAKYEIASSHTWFEDKNRLEMDQASSAARSAVGTMLRRAWNWGITDFFTDLDPAASTARPTQMSGPERA